MSNLSSPPAPHSSLSLGAGHPSGAKHIYASPSFTWGSQDHPHHWAEPSPRLTVPTDSAPSLPRGPVDSQVTWGGGQLLQKKWGPHQAQPGWCREKRPPPGSVWRFRMSAWGEQHPPQEEDRNTLTVDAVQGGPS